MPVTDLTKTIQQAAAMLGSDAIDQNVAYLEVLAARDREAFWQLIKKIRKMEGPHHD
jgi:hypothetical protein